MPGERLNGIYLHLDDFAMLKHVAGRREDVVKPKRKFIVALACCAATASQTREAIAQVFSVLVRRKVEQLFPTRGAAGIDIVVEAELDRSIMDDNVALRLVILDVLILAVPVLCP